jgi:hypothetical protein
MLREVLLKDNQRRSPTGEVASRSLRPLFLALTPTRAELEQQRIQRLWPDGLAARYRLVQLGNLHHLQREHQRVVVKNAGRWTLDGVRLKPCCVALKLEPFCRFAD